MCGRYVLFTDEEEDDITELVQAIQRNLAAGEAFRASGEVFPTQRAPVLSAQGGRAMTWGLPGYTSGVIINARAESAYEKPSFRQAMQSRRLVVPSHGFFEWRKIEGRAKDKEKRRFNWPGRRALYMAGLFNVYEGEARFAILTTAANEAMKPIHHRMPVVLSPDEISDYLHDDPKARALLERVPPALESRVV